MQTVTPAVDRAATRPPARAAPGPPKPAPGPLGDLGNQTLQRLFAAGAIQARLRVSQPNDPDEQEADRVADRVMRMPASPGGCPGGCAPDDETPCPACAARRARRVQRQAGAGIGAPPAADLATGLGPGRPLEPATRGFMEPRFGRDFGNVRIHTNDQAAQSAQSINAQAYTFGHDVVFDAGQYMPQSTSGRRLLAHELAHVVQQQSDRGTTLARQVAGPLDFSLLAERIHAAIAGWGTDEEAVYRALQECRRDPALIAQLETEYLLLYRTSLEADIRDDFSGEELEYALQLLNRGRAGSPQAIGVAPTDAAGFEALARRIRAAVEGIGTDEEAIFAALLPLNRDPGLIQSLADAYQRLFREDLRARIVDEMSGSELDYALSLWAATLTSPRLAGNPLFEQVLAARAVIRVGDSGPEVRRIQQLLIDLGHSLPVDGANGTFGAETETAVKAFQSNQAPPLPDTGEIDARTIFALDRAFPAFALPIFRASPWTMPCVLDILCPWNRHLVESVLPGFNIITFDSRSFPTETWDGSSWVGGTFSSGGFRRGTDMGFLNTTTCEAFAFTVYHEGWHGQQPSGLTGVVEVERDAYIHSEQWSISLGIPGQTFTDAATGSVEDLRRIGGAGETVVDEAAAERLVRQEYGGVSAIPGERVLSRVGATEVRVRRADGTEYTRPASVGESVRGPVTMTNQHAIDPADWDCP